MKQREHCEVLRVCSTKCPERVAGNAQTNPRRVAWLNITVDINMTAVTTAGAIVGTSNGIAREVEVVIDTEVDIGTVTETATAEGDTDEDTTPLTATR